MTITSELPDASVPGTCVDLIRRLYMAIFMGDLTTCAELQAQANDCLRQHGWPTSEKPHEYFELMHELLNLKPGVDQQREAELGARLEPYMQPAGTGSGAAIDPTEAYPADYIELAQQAEAAYAREDWPEFERLSSAIQAINDRMGIINVINIIR